MKKLNEIDVVKDQKILENVSFQSQVDEMASIFMKAYESVLDCFVKYINDNRTKPDMLYSMTHINDYMNGCMEPTLNEIQQRHIDNMKTLYKPWFRLATNIVESIERGEMEGVSKEEGIELRGKLDQYTQAEHDKMVMGVL